MDATWNEWFLALLLNEWRLHNPFISTNKIPL